MELKLTLLAKATVHAVAYQEASHFSISANVGSYGYALGCLYGREQFRSIDQFVSSLIGCLSYSFDC